jgi:hypothetical protein
MKIEYTLSVEQDDIAVRGNVMASGDDEADKACEDEIIERRNRGDVWAWALVTVTARVTGENGEEFTGFANLGGVSVENEKNFADGEGDYYDSLKMEAADDLRRSLELAVKSGNAAAKLLSVPW